MTRLTHTKAKGAKRERVAEIKRAGKGPLLERLQDEQNFIREQIAAAPPAPIEKGEKVSGFIDVMLDLETLGTGPGYIPLSIGAAAFCPQGGLGPRFYVVINTRSCEERYGLRREAATERWWQSQTEEARKVLEEARESKIGLGQALMEFAKYCDQFNRNKLRVWGNGSDFDNAILAFCYQRAEMQLPWKYWNNRCFRTLRQASNMPKPQGRVVKHNALEDAVDQAVEAMEMLRRLSTIPA